MLPAKQETTKSKDHKKVPSERNRELWLGHPLIRVVKGSNLIYESTGNHIGLNLLGCKTLKGGQCQKRQGGIRPLFLDVSVL